VRREIDLGAFADWTVAVRSKEAKSRPTIGRSFASTTLHKGAVSSERSSARSAPRLIFGFGVEHAVACFAPVQKREHEQQDHHRR